MTGAVPGSILAVFAHPDDAELWTGATLAHHAKHAAVTIAVPHRDDVRDVEARKGASIGFAQDALVAVKQRRKLWSVAQRRIFLPLWAERLSTIT